MKYKQGQYTLIYFDKTGTKKNTETFDNYNQALKASDEYKSGSAVITLVLYNSSECNDKWSYNGDSKPTK